MSTLFAKRHYEWLAAFMRRERNSLHYGTGYSAGMGSAHEDQFQAGYSVAVDGIVARLARELRDASGYNRNGNKSFDEARFLAACEQLYKAPQPEDRYITSAQRFTSISHRDSTLRDAVHTAWCAGFIAGASATVAGALAAVVLIALIAGT